MGNVNRKATPEEMEHARAVIAQAFPEYVAVFGSHSDYHGHRAPRVRTISFRLRDHQGKFHSNIVWLDPESLGELTVERLQRIVDKANFGGARGALRGRKKKRGRR